MSPTLRLQLGSVAVRLLKPNCPSKVRQPGVQEICQIAAGRPWLEASTVSMTCSDSLLGHPDRLSEWTLTTIHLVLVSNHNEDSRCRISYWPVRPQQPITVGGFYKRGCQEKTLLPAPEQRYFSDIQPLGSR